MNTENKTKLDPSTVDCGFTHLHVHTEYSLLDGAARIDGLLNLCVANNMTAIAITDHGNMYGTYYFYKRALEKGIKPIIGCEFYIVDDLTVKSGKVTQEFNHLILLAKNNEGYRNLVKLNSIAFVDGFYYKPRIDFETLKKYSGGLICLSACLAGQVPSLIIEQRIDEAKQIALQYKQLFGSDYYLEIQDHNFAEQRIVNPVLIQFSTQLDIELVATNDVHYLTRADSETQDILMCVQMGKTIDDPNRLKFSGSEFYVKTFEEMDKLFGHIGRAVSNTRVIANKCNVTISKQHLIPSFTVDDGSTPIDFLTRITYEGLRKRYDVITEQIKTRADYELEIINRMGFVEYYLIVWDFIHFAESKGIPVGPGRGSGAGSIVAYAIGITKVDPLQYNLLFERFLNPERVSMPDFDIDFCFDRRGEVIEYVIAKYGETRVSQIITFGTMAAKAAIKDVARVLNVPYAESDKLSKLIPGGKTSLKEIFGFKKSEKNEDNSIPELIEIYRNDLTLKRVVDYAIALEGTPRNTSTHAAGVVICSDDISNYVPLQRNGNDITTQFDMIEVEELGLLKMDFLGLRTLTDISKAIEIIKKSRGVDVSFDNCKYDDENIYKLITSGDVDAVFQLESPGMKRLMRDLKPNCLENIIAGISLFRPGPMQSIPDYIKCKNNPDEVKYAHPLLEPILKVTNGIMVYQEQVIQIVRDVGGFTLAGADEVRRAMGKKDLVKMAKQKELFLAGATQRGVSKKVADEIFALMSKFAEYAFNKSHAAAYAMLSYQTAYLKYYYQVEYLAAVLNNRITNNDEIKKYGGYCVQHNIKMLPPDINSSDVGFSVNDNQIRFGLAAIKNVGTAVINSIIEQRNSKGKFIDIYDFVNRVDESVLNKRMLESLIKSGAFDCFNIARSQLMAGYEGLIERISRDKRKRDSGQFSIFDSMPEATIEYKFPNIAEYNNKYKLAAEKEVLGMYISGNPLTEYKNKFTNNTFNLSMLEFDDSGELTDSKQTSDLDNAKVTMGGMITELTKKMTKTNRQMAYGRLEDLYGSIEVVFYPKIFEKYRSVIENDVIVNISGLLYCRAEEKPKIFADTMEVLSSETESFQTETVSDAKLYIKMKKDNSLFNDINQVLNTYLGDCTVIFVIDNKSLKSNIKVRQCNAVLLEISELVGKENVKFVTTQQ